MQTISDSLWILIEKTTDLEDEDDKIAFRQINQLAKLLDTNREIRLEIERLIHDNRK